ncbi:MAG: nickel-dependent lactate racemase family protein [Acidimicrobiales bacterium]
MRLTLAYGREGLEVEVPDDAEVVLPRDRDPVGRPREMVLDAVRNPHSGPRLAELVRAGQHVVVVFPDITRPMPNQIVLPPILEELSRLGAGPDEVELLCATGLHRAATDEELLDLTGPEIFGAYRIHQHVADSSDHKLVGDVDGFPVYLDSRYVDADVRICTGFVEPHFFAGYSGGLKAVCPGLALTETILEAHSTSRVRDKRATWKQLDGNPVHEFIRSAATLLAPDLLVDVTINRRHEVTAVFAGCYPESYLEACAFVDESVTCQVPGRFDVVVSTNGGYPLDRNLYQAVKGMAAAEQVVADGGIIIVAAECRDGVPSNSAFGELVAGRRKPKGEVCGIDRTTRESWQVEVLNRILRRAEVWLYSGGLTDAEIHGSGLHPVGDVSTAVVGALKKKGPDSTVCVLPEGPFCVAEPAPVSL